MRSAAPERTNLAAIRLERLKTFGSPLNSAGCRSVSITIGRPVVFGRFCGKTFLHLHDPATRTIHGHLGWKEWSYRYWLGRDLQLEVGVATALWAVSFPERAAGPWLQLAERVSSRWDGTEPVPPNRVRPAANIPALANLFARLREETSANDLRAMQHGCFSQSSFLSIARLDRGGTKSK